MKNIFGFFLDFAVLMFVIAPWAWKMWPESIAHSALPYLSILGTLKPNKDPSLLPTKTSYGKKLWKCMHDTDELTP
jgi:hypothetical protein